MKTTFDQDTILYQMLIASDLKRAITGDVYKMVRPNGSKAEDVVINTILTDTSQVQRGASNVNIYVPSIQVEGDTLPDTARMGELAALAMALLQDVYKPLYHLWVSNQTTIDESGPSWYVNLRIEFQFFPSH